MNNLIIETVGEAGSHEILVHCCREYKLAHPFQRTIWKIKTDSDQNNVTEKKKTTVKKEL